MNDNLEHKLKHALETRDPGPGFAHRVMARINERPRPWWTTWRVALAGGLASLMIGGVALQYQQRQERMRAAAAREQLLLALQITRTELTKVRSILQERSR
jgi:hypothetical protein